MAVFNADVEQARGDDPSAGGADGAETIDSADAVDSADASDAGLRFDPDAQAQLAAWADGDARRLINAVEVVAESALGAGRTLIDASWLETSLSQNLRRFDKGGDAFYDQISALHKSVRGSDPDAALYRSEEHTSELQSLMRNSYAGFCL